MTRSTRFGVSIQPEIGGSDLAKQPSELDIWTFLQPEFQKHDLAKQSSEFDFFVYFIFEGDTYKYIHE